jgi:hypothetical protein
MQVRQMLAEAGGRSCGAAAIPCSRAGCHPRCAAAAALTAQVIAAKEAGSAAPVRNFDGNTFQYIRHKDMYFVAVSRTNANSGARRRRRTGG